MNETSRLSIVVDVSNAQQKLKDFTSQLNEAKKAGEQLSSSASQSSQGLNNQAQSANKAQIEANKLAISNKKVEAQNNRTASSIQGLVSAEARAAMSQNNLQASAVKLVTAGKQQEMQNNRTASSAAQLVVSNQRIAITAEQLATAQFKTVTASNQAAASNNRLSVSAIQVSTANNRLLTSAAQTAAAQTRETIATTNLARANWSLVTAATGAATAEQRLALQTSNAAAAALRAQREAVNLAAAQARLAAQADRAAGGMNAANAASRGLYGSMSKLYTLMNSGLVVVFGLGFIKQAADMQNLNNQIRLVTDSEREYLVMKKEVIKVANDNFASIDATIGLYQKSVRALTNLGKSQADSLKFTEAVSLAMRTGGRSAGENAAAILQLGQAMGAGVIMGDEFRSISENAPVLLDLVAKEMGVMRGELKKLSADGKITAEIMYNALTKNMPLLLELTKKMPLTMGQAFTVAKNKFKEYSDQMMNSTGGVSDKISGMLVKMSANFDTIAKVGMAGMILGMVGMTASIVTATNAMRVFNFVTSANPLMLIVSGFLLITSAIYGTNEVMTISGLVMADVYNGMVSDLEKVGEKWDWLKDKISEVMGESEKIVGKSNNNNEKNFLGFYKTTEDGFAGLIQHIEANMASVSALVGSLITYYKGLSENLMITITNLITAFGNLGKMVANLFGADITLGEFKDYKVLDILKIYESENSPLQSAAQTRAQKRNREAGLFQEDPTNTQNSKKLAFDFGNQIDRLAKPIGNGVRALNKFPIEMTNVYLKGAVAQGEIQAGSLAQYEASQARLLAEENKKKEGKDREKKKSLLKLVVTGGDYYPTGKGGEYGAKRAGRPLGHQALDLSTPVGTKLYAPEGGTLTYGGSKSSGEGLTASIKTLSGVVYKFLHLNNYNHPEGQIPAGVSFGSSGNTGVKKGGGKYANHSHIEVFDKKGNRVNPTNYRVGKPDGGYDSKYADALSSQQKEAEKTRIDQAKEAARKLEEQLKTQLELYKQYGTKRQEINAELEAVIIKIQGSGAPQAVITEQIKQAQKEADAKYSVYADGLTRQIGALNEAQKTERELIKQTNKYLRDDANNNADLNRKGNEDFLTATLTAIDVKEAYEIQALEDKLDKEYNDLYDFRRTDRELFEKDWFEKMKMAEKATDENKQYRIDALKEQYAVDKELFNLNEIQKRNDLNSYKLSDVEKMVQEAAMARARIPKNATEEERREQSNAAGDPIKSGLNDLMNRLNPQSPMELLRQEHEANLELISAYEAEIGLIEGDARTERLAAEKSYQDAKFALATNSGASLFSALGGFAKDMLGQQSQTYRVLFAIEKGFYIAQSVMAIKASYAKATAMGVTPWDKAFYIAEAVTTGVGILSQLKQVQMNGFKQGGYTGNGGVNDIAGAVHGQEYVFDAQATRDIGVGNLEALRSGKSIGGDVNVNIINNSSARVQASDDGKTITISDVINEVKNGFTRLGNPNSHESKMVGRNVQAPRRR